MCMKISQLIEEEQWVIWDWERTSLASDNNMTNSWFLFFEFITEFQRLNWSLKSSDNIATASEIRSKLDENTAFIDYFHMHDLSGAIIATMTKDKIDFHFEILDAPIDKKIKALRNAMLAWLNAVSNKFGRELYTSLITSASFHIGKKDKWIIVPDNILGY